MPLSDASIRSAKPQAKAYKLADGNNLVVQVTPSGGKLWLVRYRFNGKPNTLSLGAYPAVSLKDARLARDEAQKLLAAGRDPNAEKRRRALEGANSAANTFKALAAEFIAKKLHAKAPATRSKAEWFSSLLAPALGKRPVAEIDPIEILNVLRSIEKQGNHETAKRTRAFASRVFDYAIVTCRAKDNPAARLGKALEDAPPVKHHAAILEPNKVGELLRAIDGYQGHVSTRLALKLAPHVFVRPGELRHAEWSELDFDKAIWRIPAAKMKMREDHVVPLSRQAVAIFKEAEEVRGNSKYVFPAVRTWLRPMSENTLNAALRRLGYTSDEMTSHGFRSTASSLLNESGKWSADAIERALAHQDKNVVRGIYHRSPHWEERVRMAQWWSDYLDVLRGGAQILAFGSAQATG